MGIHTPGDIGRLASAAAAATTAAISAFAVTHTSDTALATVAAGGTQIGSNVTVTGPTAGAYRLTLLEGEFDETGAAAVGKIGIAVDVGGTKVFATTDLTTGSSANDALEINTGVASRLVGSGVRGSTYTPIVVSFDIAANSFPTGSQTLQVYFGDEADGSTGAVTVTGTTVTCRVLVEVIDTT